MKNNSPLLGVILTLSQTCEHMQKSRCPFKQTIYTNARNIFKIFMLSLPFVIMNDFPLSRHLFSIRSNQSGFIEIEADNSNIPPIWPLSGSFLSTCYLAQSFWRVLSRIPAKFIKPTGTADNYRKWRCIKMSPFRSDPEIRKESVQGSKRLGAHVPNTCRFFYVYLSCPFRTWTITVLHNFLSPVALTSQFRHPLAPIRRLRDLLPFTYRPCVI